MRFSVSMVAPRPHHRVVESTVEGARVLFHLDERRLHVLNPSASAIWAELDDAATVGDVTIRVADRFGLDPATVRADVEQLIDRFRADGLLTVDDGIRAVRCRRPEPAALPVEERLPVSGSFGALDAAIAVETDDAELAAVLDEVLRPLHGDRSPTTAIRITGADDGPWESVVDDGPPVRLFSKLALVLRVLAEVNDAAVRSAPDDLVLHAGAVADGAGAVLLPAASNHGKSTLTTALVASGLGYLTDEAAAVGEGLMARPFPKSIVLDPGSFPLFADLEPPASAGLAAALVGREWHVDPRRVGTIAGPAPVRVVVCPHWRAGASTRVHRCSPSEAMQVLLGDAFDFEAGGQVVFERMAELVQTVPVYRLGYSDLRQAVDQISGLLADAPTI